MSENLASNGVVARPSGLIMEESLRKTLLSLARKVLENRLRGDLFDLEEFNIPDFQNERGLFVTLSKKDALRGCIGRIEPNGSIFQNVIDLSRAAAFEDNRFSPLTTKELDDVTIEISILTLPREIQGKDSLDKVSKIRPDIDGVIISGAGGRATFLPQVWKSLPDREEFMSHLCVKAALGADYWKKNPLKISAYQVESFEEE